MSIRKKAIIMSIGIGLFFIWLVYYITNKDLYANYNYDIKSQTQVLNEFLSKKYGNKYKLYAANFNENDSIPDIGHYDNNAILWLGKKEIKISNDVINKIKKFGIVITSDFKKLTILDIIGIEKKAQFPVFTEDKKINSVKEYYALLGNPVYAKNVIKKNKLQYKTYNFSQIDKLKYELNNIKAIIIEQNKKNIYDMDPVLLSALNSGIPIIEQKNKFISSPQSLVGHIIRYYYTEDGLKDIIKKIEDELKTEDYHKEAEWIDYYFTKKAALNRLEKILEGKSENIDLSLINWDIRGYSGYSINGDIWLINDLLQKIDKTNYNHITTFEDSTYRPQTSLSIFIRGKIDDILDKIVSPNNVLWLAYPDINNKKTNEVKVTFNDYVDEIVEISPHFKKIAVASRKIQEALNIKGINAVWIPQFTNVEKFYPDYEEDKKSEILFVGHNHFKRRSAIYVKNNKLPITIYGKWWPKGWAKAEYIDNKILRKYYSSAKIVLSDQLKSMTEFGVIVNRIYDVTACKTLVISEYAPEIENMYGSCVPMWKTEEELISLIKYYLSHEEERKQKVECAYNITIENFTTEKIAKEFEKIILETQNQQNNNQLEANK